MQNDIFEQARQLAARPYPFQVFKDDEADEDIRYLAKNPDLEGCMAQGATINEALASLADARIDYISFLLERGLPVPEPSELAPAVSTVSTPFVLYLSKSSSEQESVLPLEESELLYEASVKT